MRKVLLIMTLLLAMVTQGAWAQLGRVLATDGKYYKTVTAATNAGTTASGMIVYWGDGDTSDNTYNQGLAIALSDVINNGQWGAKQQDVTGITNTGSNAASSMVDLRGIANTDAIVSKWPTGTYSYAADHCASMSTARPSSSSNWFLPSQGQFVLMMNSYGAGYGTSTSYAYDNTTKGAVVTAINNALTNAGGTALSNGRYWTSTEINIYAAGDWSASNSSFGYNDKPGAQNVRAMFAFSGATAAEYTVSYNANGGSGAPSAQTKDGGIDLTLSSTQPTRDGYTFAGWATSADGAVAYSAGGSYTTNDDIVLYAQWTPVTYNAALATGTPTGWSITPTTPEEGSTVTVSYTGQHRVKSVKVVKKVAAWDGTITAQLTAKLAYTGGEIADFTDATDDLTTMTWAVNEHIAILYEVSGTKKVADAEITAVDGTTGTATITFTVDGGTTNDTPCTLVYPLSAAKDDHTGVKDAATLLAAQDGTLNANLDVRVGAGTIQTSTPGLTVTTQPAAQYAIFKFTTKSVPGGGSALQNKDVTKLTVTIGAQDYVITPASATSTLYAALPAVSGQTVSFTATDGSNLYAASKASVSFDAAKYYQSTVKMGKVIEVFNYKDPWLDDFRTYADYKYLHIGLDQAYDIAGQLSTQNGGATVAVVYNYEGDDNWTYALSSDNSATARTIGHNELCGNYRVFLATLWESR